MGTESSNVWHHQKFGQSKTNRQPDVTVNHWHISWKRSNKYVPSRELIEILPKDRQKHLQLILNKYSLFFQSFLTCQPRPSARLYHCPNPYCFIRAKRYLTPDKLLSKLCQIIPEPNFVTTRCADFSFIALNKISQKSNYFIYADVHKMRGKNDF